MPLIDPRDNSLANPLDNAPKNTNVLLLPNLAWNNSISSTLNNSSTSSVLNANTNYNTIVINLNSSTDSN